jgi:succinate dehydrogenase/fumarate reductase cytochrome b subunit
MRKLNTILSLLLIIIFMLHGVMGSFMLIGVGSIAGKILAWIGVCIIVVHTVFGVLLTVNTFKQSKNNGKLYLKQNALFWTRRASGLAILIMVFFHIGLFGKVMDGQYILFEFTPVKLMAQMLLIAALFIHVFVNIRPLLISLGVIKNKERRVDIFLVLSILLLFMAGSTVIYFIGWTQ